MESEPDRPHLQASLLLIFLFLPSWEIAAAIPLVLILLAASAMVSGSEIAFFSLTHNDFAKLEEEKTVSAERILKLKEKPRRLLATILITNNFINVAIVIVSDFLVQMLFSDAIFKLWANVLLQIFSFLSITEVWLTGAIRFAVVVLSVTFLLVLFGEVAPKIYAKLHNIQLAKFMSRPLMILTKLFFPLSRLMVQGTNLIENRLEKTGSVASKEEIGEAIELIVRDETDTQDEIDLLKSIVSFGDVAAKQIMRSRVDVVAVDFRIGFQELLKVVRDSGFSRIPVYEEELDHITGVLYAKDLLGYLNESDDFEWQSLIRANVFYVPEAKKISDLLKEFQEERLHLAIVVDEYGGTSGIVTLEDILEEVIGEIKDEFDDEIEVDYKKIDDHNYLFEGKTMLNDVCRVIGVETDTFDEIRGDADSVAGLMLEVIGKIPKVDREISIDNFKFKVVSVTKRRIEQVLLTIT